MGMWQRWTGIEALPPAMSNDEVETRDTYWSVSDPATAFLFGMGNAELGVVTDQTAMTLSAVYRSASIVASSIAGLPLKTMQQENGYTQQVPSFLDNPGSTSISDGVLYTPFEWKELVGLHLLFHGNAFLQHIKNGAGAIVALNPVHPGSVHVEWDASAYGGKRFKIVQADGTALELDGRGMTQIMAMSLDGLRGMSVVTQARQSFSTAMSGDKAASKMFKTGAMVSGIATPAQDEEIGTDDAEKIKDSIVGSMTGAENAGSIAFVNRRIAIQPWSQTAADAQFLESRTFQIDEIGRWFGVPPHLLGLTEKSTSWGQGIAEQNRGLARYTLLSWTNRIQERLSTLLNNTSRWAEFDYTTFVKPAPEDEIRLLIDQVNNGLLTLNEARAIRNLSPLEGGDQFRLPAGSLPPSQYAPGAEGTPSPVSEGGSNNE